ncbi:MAG: hypothetical protein ABIN01_21710 [Ferruginibacter sp.]
MTYCVAWKTKNTAFLISDTAMTTDDKSENNKPIKKLTSFGEKTFHSKNITVEEWALKQFKIDDNFIICYAGAINKAEEIITTIKKYYLKGNPLRSLQLAVDSVRDINIEEVVQFLFAFNSNGYTSLFSYNIDFDNDIKEIPENSLIQIGSLSSSQYPYNEVANRFFNEHVLNLTSPTKQFYQFLSYFQHLGLHDNTLKKFAGGLYSGLYLDNNGSCWNEDTSIIIYNRNLSNPKIQILGRINYFFRYDCLILFSSFTNQKELFLDSAEHPVYKSLQLQDEIDSIHYTFVPKIIVFLAKDYRSISTIKTNGKNDNIHFFDKNNDGEIITKFTYNFIRLLKGAPFPPEYIFNLYWDEIT